ncbi:MAG: hypothetical protein HKL95_08870 [Phycisphaerae bacterium]|nr:hypothetical protein [Phycisphaerae bacterium]
MGRDQSVIFPKKTRWSGGHGGAMWPALAIAAMCVLAIAVKVAVALAYAGPVTVTANMGAFSPNPVKVNSSATSSLSANYTPPSGVSEGTLSAQYDWSISVQYKALEADTFGAPPSGSYTDSISPTQPSTSSSATLTFTPLIAGYWQISASCGVTVTDTKTNQYWSGSANAGPEDLTSYTLDIAYTGPVVGGGSDSGTVVTNKTTAVHAGWPVQLGVKLAPSDLATKFSWSIDGAGGNGDPAIGGYTYSTSDAQVATLNPANTTGNSFGPYYYVASGTYKASVQPTGTSIAAVLTDFGITRPSGNLDAEYESNTIISNMGNGKEGISIGCPFTNPPIIGIEFKHPPVHSSSWQGHAYFVQVYTENDFWTGAGLTPNYSAFGTGLDELDPYPSWGTLPDGEDYVADAPGLLVDTNYSSLSVDDSPDMWLMYTPAAKGSIDIPLAEAEWVWGGTLTYANQTWSLVGGFPNFGSLPRPAAVVQPVLLYPTWQQVLQPPNPPN